MDWKFLIVLCSLAVVGHGILSRKEFYGFFKDELSKSLNTSLSFKDKNSLKDMDFIHDLIKKEIFETINVIFATSTLRCNNLDQIFQLHRNYSTGMKTIFQPLNSWINEAHHCMDNVDLHIRNLPKNERYLDVYESIQYLERVQDWLTGDCLNRLPTNKTEIYVTSDGIGGDCANESFLCGSGECIDFNRTCDGSFDCWDGSDELGRCSDDTQCLGCNGLCTIGPREPRCLEKCPPGFNYTFKICKGLKSCYRVCYRGDRIKPLTPICLIHILPNVLDSISDRIPDLKDETYGKFIDIIRETYMCRNLAVEDLSWHTTTRHPTWHTTTHPTWHPTTRHPTWHTTTRHPTWHPTTRHSTWHTTTHPTWHPTTRHPTWHTTTRHPTWHPTTRHSTWHTTTHPTWHPTTRHPTWHPTTRHSTWHTTTHPTWHPTTRHSTWHTATHPTWHPTTTSHTTWNPAMSPSTDSDEYDEGNNHTPKHHTTKHTTRHTTKHTTQHTTKHITPTTTSPTTTQHTTKHITPTTTSPTTTQHTTKHITPTTTSPTTTTPTTTTSIKPFLLKYEVEDYPVFANML